MTDLAPPQDGFLICALAAPDVAADLAAGLRTLGRSALVASTSHDSDITFSVSVLRTAVRGLGTAPVPTLFEHGNVLRSLRRVFLDAATVVFVGPGSLLGGRAEVGVAHQLGRRVVVLDPVDLGPAGLLTHVPVHAPTQPPGGSSEQMDAHETIDRLASLRRCEFFADGLAASSIAFADGLRPFYHFDLPIDLDQRPFEMPRGGVTSIVFDAADARAPLIDRVREAVTGLDTRLTPLPDQPNDRRAALAAADIVLAPRRSNAVDRIRVEGWASACAVATDVPAATDFSCDDDRLARIHNADSFRALLSDRHRIRALAESGRRQAESRNAPSVTAAKLLDIIECRASELHRPRRAALDALPQTPGADEEMRRMGTTLVQRWGIPRSADLTKLVEARVVDADSWDATRPAPRWPEATRPPEGPSWAPRADVGTEEVHEVALAACEAALAGHREAAQAALGQLVPHLEGNASALTDGPLLATIGRAARELGDIGLAIDLWRLALTSAPDLVDVQTALSTIDVVPNPAKS